MKPASNKAKWWQIYAVSAAACAAVTAGVYFASVQPALRKHDAEAALRDDLQAKRRRIGELRTSVSIAQKQLDAVNEALAKARVRLQPATLVNDRLERLTDLANECGLTIDEVHPGEVVDTPFFQTVAIKLAGTGAYPAFAKFLHALHDTFPDTGVRALESSNNSPNPLMPVGLFKIELTWYASPAGGVAQAN